MSYNNSLKLSTLSLVNTPFPIMKKLVNQSVPFTLGRQRFAAEDVVSTFHQHAQINLLSIYTEVRDENELQALIEATQDLGYTELSFEFMAGFPDQKKYLRLLRKENKQKRAAGNDNPEHNAMTTLFLLKSPKHISQLKNAQQNAMKWLQF